MENGVVAVQITPCQLLSYYHIIYIYYHIIYINYHIIRFSSRMENGVVAVQITPCQLFIILSYNIDIYYHIIDIYTRFSSRMENGVVAVQITPCQLLSQGSPFNCYY